MNRNYDKLKTLLKELFQLDQPDLDFGLYRVMHAKSGEVTQFLEKDLLPQVQAAFAQYKTADKSEVEKELAKLIASIEAAGMDPAQSPKVKDLRARLANDAVDVGALESEVYDHLFTFFRRYYSDGDFLAKRVYKPGVYAIPYEGEEVTLHWANKDQYYIKTSEYLRDYAFRLRPDDSKNPMRVHFRLADASEGEHGNVKAAEGKERVFILAEAGASGRDFLAEEAGEQGKDLVVRFEYRPATVNDWPADVREGKTKPPAQKDLLSSAAKRVLAVGDAAFAPWLAALGAPNINADGTKAEYSRLDAHLKRYTARNTFDYFIHKDLGGFLRRELDFFVKNEVMHLDDVENETAPRVEQYLSKIKVVRKIAGKVIDFLAQLEDFQKRLWLKKRFVIETRYCITLGRIPEEFYPEITASTAQREEWIQMFASEDGDTSPMAAGLLGTLTVTFLRDNPTLMVDTRHLPGDLTARLVEALSGDLDAASDGLLVHGDCFQALRLMRRGLHEQVSCIYIDPPYNTGNDGFVYKDNYQHSSWLTALDQVLEESWHLLEWAGPLMASIDDGEQRHLWELLGSVFGDANRVAPFIWKRKAGGGDDSHNVASEHEYVLVSAKSLSSLRMNRIMHESPSMTAKYNRSENGRRYYLERLDKPSLPYVPSMDFAIPAPDGTPVWPPQPSASSRTTRWRWGREKAREDYSKLEFLQDEQTGEWRVYTRTWAPDERGVTARSLLSDAEIHGRNRDGTEDISKLFNKRVFSNPKPLKLLRHLLTVGIRADAERPLVLDFFAGSGTTAHATISLNRDDGRRRKFVAVEVGQHFENVLVRRMQKATFSPEWRNGAPVRAATSEEARRGPGVVKVVKLESYEDTLNNLEMRRTAAQQSLLEAQRASPLREEYLLRYMLDTETRGCQSLLNIGAFSDPTAYKLWTKRHGSDEGSEVNVDLVETFSWLLGLSVRQLSAPRSFKAAFERDTERRLRLKGRLKQDADGPYWFRTVTGTTPDGRKTLVIWRKLTGDAEKDNLVLDEWFTKQGYSAKDSEFDLIYVNGGNNLENLKAADDTWKVRLIEEDFHRLMFDTEGD